MATAEIDTGNPAVARFREYLRIKSNHPNPDYTNCIKWLRNQAEEIGLEFSIVKLNDPGAENQSFDADANSINVKTTTISKVEDEEIGKNSKAFFAVWMTWLGRNPSLPSIFLNSHIDVVPVDPEKWTHDPFEAYKDTNGNIYARGSQDMKCVGVQYLEVIRNLKNQNFIPLRTVHVAFVPDEERGGFQGMNLFVKSKEFQNLNVGFGMDEGIANSGESFDLFYAERVVWQFEFTAKGQTGHASLLHENTAAKKIQKVIDRMLELRTKEKLRKETNTLDIGEVTSINLTQIAGGIQPNVVPPELSVVFDMRITPSWKLNDVEKLLNDICTEAGSDVTLKYIAKCPEASVTQLTDDNPWWVTFKLVTDSLGLKLNKLIFPGGTDSRYLRELGIPALGFSPMNYTPILLHDHDEFLNENVFLKGIEIYEAILKNIFNEPPFKA